jgi:hypothetical protein
MTTMEVIQGKEIDLHETWCTIGTDIVVRSILSLSCVNSTR